MGRGGPGGKEGGPGSAESSLAAASEPTRSAGALPDNSLR